MREFKTPKGTTLPLLDLKGKSYLQVAHRLVWFREEKPDWSIETEIVEGPGSCTAKATIRNSESRVVATAHKHEDKQGFADYREKAETGAIGRALALCGYGTQFAPELEEGERLADSPLVRHWTQGAPPQETTLPSGSGAFCAVCKAELKLSKSGAAFYCPKFKDTSQGEHTRIKAAELIGYVSWQGGQQETKPGLREDDIPF